MNEDIKLGIAVGRIGRPLKRGSFKSVSYRPEYVETVIDSLKASREDYLDRMKRFYRGIEAQLDLLQGRAWETYHSKLEEFGDFDTKRQERLREAWSEFQGLEGHYRDADLSLGAIAELVVKAKSLKERFDSCYSRR